MEDQNSAEEAKPLGGTRKEKQHHTGERRMKKKGKEKKEKVKKARSLCEAEYV